MGIELVHRGDFSKTENWLNSLMHRDYIKILEKYGKLGVEALREATPKDTGLTADSWNYEIIQNGRETGLRFVNTNIQEGINVAIILQYGHGTRDGGYVRGIDYINPALKPVFDKLAEEAFREIRK